MIDLDDKPATRAVRSNRWGWAPGFLGAFAGVLFVAALGAVVRAPADTPAAPVLPVIEVTVEGLTVLPEDRPELQWQPTITAWFADGTTAAPAPLGRGEPWQPDRPIRMLTVVAAKSCTIVVDGQVAVDQ